MFISLFYCSPAFIDRTTKQKLLNSKQSRHSLKQLLLKTQTTNCSKSVNDHWRSSKL